MDSTLLVTMDRMAKFRNVVVHPYEEVDAEIVIAILRKRLPAVEQYISAILTYLKEDQDCAFFPSKRQPGPSTGWESLIGIASRSLSGVIRKMKD